MNSSNYRFTLDIQSRQSQVSLPVLLNDTARKLYISLSDGGNAYHIADGCRAVFVARKSDETILTNACIIENNVTIRYDFTKQTASREGIVKCEIRLYGADGKLITSPRFIMVVDSRVVYDSDTVVSESENTTFDSLVLELNTLINEVTTKLENGEFVGEPGKDGLGISKVEKTSTRDLVDTYTITLTDGSTATFTVTNGHSPIKGVDYFTEAEKQAIINEVIVGAADGDEVSY